ncbi:hypothetical protein GGR56DRAFT_418874 [Xylariaceae sp. FL0804]|nr:hypothetical protein GGR56DRAFT_418874 [Xylariaceae sp. FL0804]
MPAQTRSGGKPPDKETTYRSTPAAPRQHQFSHRRRTIKTYGRRTPARLMKQGTLTQMDFTSSAMQDVADDLDEEEEDHADEEKEEEEVLEMPKPAASGIRLKRKGRGSRRKTTGDELEVQQKPKGSKRRKTLGDSPSATVSSSYHTQTLTQMLSSREEQEEMGQISDSDLDGSLGLIETPRKKKDGQPTKGHPQSSALSAPDLTKSITPSNRQKMTEIPSTQSPQTPMLMRYSPASQNSPLKQKSANAATPRPIIKNVYKTPRNLVIPDSYSSATGSSPITPTPKSTIKATPSKRIRFDLPGDKENITPGRTKPKSPKPATRTAGRRPLQEIPDSDEEFGSEYETEDEADGPAVEEMQGTEDQDLDTADLSNEPEAAVSPHGGTSLDRQARSLSPDREESQELAADVVREEPAVASTPQEASSPLAGKGVEADDRPSTAGAAEQISSPPSPDGTAVECTSTTQDYGYTQGPESQRLPLEAIHAFGPQTPRSDIMVSLHPEHVAKIVDRTKDHEFRVWKIPPEVSRVWMYITKPASELRYMCLFSPPKGPGEILDENGLGNAEFNQRKTIMKYAYEILQVYELNNPPSLEEMKAKGWVAGAPQKYTFIPPAVVGELTANLRCALFEEEALPKGVMPRGSNETESQELRAQLQSDADYSTQHYSTDNTADSEVIPASQSPPHRRGNVSDGNDNFFSKPALPSTSSKTTRSSAAVVPATSGLLPSLPSQRPPNVTRPSQATTISQASSSSPAVSPEKQPSSAAASRRPAAAVVVISSQSLPAAAAAAAAGASEPTEEGGSSPTTALRRAHHNSSLRSSQFPTRSQMLPESLLNDAIEEPPPIVWDSADEQSD